MIKLVFLNLQDLIILYLFKLKHLLDRCINLRRDFFDGIESNHKYFDHKRHMYQPNIIEIVVYYGIIIKKLDDKYKIYNNKKCTM